MQTVAGRVAVARRRAPWRRARFTLDGVVSARGEGVARVVRKDGTFETKRRWRDPGERGRADIRGSEVRVPDIVSPALSHARCLQASERRPRVAHAEGTRRGRLWSTNASLGASAEKFKRGKFYLRCFPSMARSFPEVFLGLGLGFKYIILELHILQRASTPTFSVPKFHIDRRDQSQPARAD